MMGANIRVKIGDGPIMAGTGPSANCLLREAGGVARYFLRRFINVLVYGADHLC